MLNDYVVKTYLRGQRYHFKLLWLGKDGAGESEHSYDSGQKNSEGYALDEEANQAGWKTIQCTLLNILNLFVKRWPKGCPVQEWQAFPAVGAPAMVWDRIFYDLVQGEYIKDQKNEYMITEKGKDVCTQLKELGNPSYPMTSIRSPGG
jgi:hypothetical protein